ncbi:MAG: ATP-binding cassette domain-containing protein [bacterium]
MITVDHLSLAFPTPTALHSVLSDLSFTINDNEFIALMGANGSGKTSLARCLNGILSPSGGEVLVDGLNTKNAHDLIEIRRRVGMVFQNPDNQMVTPTVEREIAFGLENLAVPRGEMHARVEEMLIRFDLNALRRRAPHELSGGEKQRVALASIMAMQPRYLILDEPTSLLDYPSRVRLFETIVDLRQARAEAGEKLAVLLISQFSEETLFADRLLVLNQGRIMMDGRPTEILQGVEGLLRFGLQSPIEFHVHQALMRKAKLSIPFEELMLSPVL